MNSLFEEYLDKNIAIVLIESVSSEDKKIYLNAKIQNKNISKSLSFKKKESFSRKYFCSRAKYRLCKF